jgi:hypothetical protein
LRRSVSSAGRRILFCKLCNVIIGKRETTSSEVPRGRGPSICGRVYRFAQENMSRSDAVRLYIINQFLTRKSSGGHLHNIADRETGGLVVAQESYTFIQVPVHCICVGSRIGSMIYNDVRRFCMLPLATWGSYLRYALQEGSADDVACLPAPRAGSAEFCPLSFPHAGFPCFYL